MIHPRWLLESLNWMTIIEIGHTSGLVDLCLLFQYLRDDGLNFHSVETRWFIAEQNELFLYIFVMRFFLNLSGVISTGIFHLIPYLWPGLFFRFRLSDTVELPRQDASRCLCHFHQMLCQATVPTRALDDIAPFSNVDLIVSHTNGWMTWYTAPNCTDSKLVGFLIAKRLGRSCQSCAERCAFYGSLRMWWSFCSFMVIALNLVFDCFCVLLPRKRRIWHGYSKPSNETLHEVCVSRLSWVVYVDVFLWSILRWSAECVCFLRTRVRCHSRSELWSMSSSQVAGTQRCKS